MRYVTKAERERQRKLEQERAERHRWMTLVAAVKYIQDRGGLNEDQASEDIVYAIIDGRIEAQMCELQPSDLQGEVTVCLDGPGYIKVDNDAPPPKPRNSKRHTIGYPKITIVRGPCFKVPFDKADPYTPKIIPEVNDLDYAPVSVSREDLEKWPFTLEQGPLEIRSDNETVAAGAKATAKKRPGRPAGSGSWAKVDARLIAEMHSLIQSGDAKSANDAAARVVNNAQGSGTSESKQARLAKGYRRTYCSERK